MYVCAACVAGYVLCFNTFYFTVMLKSTCYVSKKYLLCKYLYEIILLFYFWVEYYMKWNISLVLQPANSNIITEKMSELFYV